MKLALCGLSRVADAHHLPAITTTRGIELVAVASQHRGLDGVPWYPTLEALLAQEITADSVVICSPPLLRQQQAALALQAGRNVLLERPPGATLSQVAALVGMAQQAGLTLVAGWPARFTPAVEAARALLARCQITAVRLVWTEDARAWQAEDDWIWHPGGLGVFHAGIDGLSVLTRVMPELLAVSSATLHIAPDREEPVAAELSLQSESGVAVEAVMDVRPGVASEWTLEFQTATGPIQLAERATVLRHDGRVVPVGRATQYRAMYRRFLELTEAGTGEVDTAPLRQVADAHLIAQRVAAAPFGDGGTP